MATKLKKIKQKRHKSAVKRFKITASGKVSHMPQGSGHGHSRNYMNRRQRKAKSKSTIMKNSDSVIKIKKLIG